MSLRYRDPRRFDVSFGESENATHRRARGTADAATAGARETFDARSTTLPGGDRALASRRTRRNSLVDDGDAPGGPSALENFLIAAQVVNSQDCWGKTTIGPDGVRSRRPPQVASRGTYVEG